MLVTRIGRFRVGCASNLRGPGPLLLDLLFQFPPVPILPSVPRIPNRRNRRRISAKVRPPDGQSWWSEDRCWEESSRLGSRKRASRREPGMPMKLLRRRKTLGPRPVSLVRLSARDARLAPIQPRGPAGPPDLASKEAARGPAVAICGRLGGTHRPPGPPAAPPST